MMTRDNFNQLYIDLIDNVLTDGIKSSPRGMDIKELICYPFKLTNPKNCLCTISSRKLNYAFTIIEKLEYLSGESDPMRLCFYNSNMRNFINEETGKFDGAYGPRIQKQLRYIYNLLKEDKDSRQAVININNESDKHKSKDIPCTVSLQFLLRDNKLHLIVNMRSNDVLWGTPYDVNAFCFIQEVLATWLNVEIGDYYHIPGSLHIYKSTEDKLRAIYQDRYHSNEWLLDDIENPTFDIKSIDDTYTQISKFWYYEEEFRKGNFIEHYMESKALSEYLEIIKKYCIKKLTK